MKYSCWIFNNIYGYYTLIKHVYTCKCIKNIVNRENLGGEQFFGKI